MIDINSLNVKIPHSVKVEIATRLRDYKEVAETKTAQEGGMFEVDVEVFNSKTIFELPNSVGITIAYPSLLRATHIKSEIFPLSIGEVEFGNRVLLMISQLKEKVG